MPSDEGKEDPSNHVTAESVLNPPWYSKLPMIGWIFLRSESPLFGRRFWLRPMLIELLFPIFLGWLYRYEVGGGLLPVAALNIVPSIQLSLHLQFLCHAILCCLMCIATFIDFDERTIPDWITVPGTLIGVLLTTIGSLFAPVHLWIALEDIPTKTWPITMDWLSPIQIVGQRIYSIEYLALGFVAYSVWCFAIADRRWIMRRGLRKAFEYFLAGLVRRPMWKLTLAIWIVGLILIAIGWSLLPEQAWRACLTSLVGAMIGGLLVWAVRIVASASIGVEALGFGDVTLMCMVGAYVGWQPTWIAFFVAPIVAIVFVVANYLITGDKQTPFGPYLCGGTLFTLIGWDTFWNQRLQGMILVIGFELFFLLGMGLVLMGLMLWSWRLIKAKLG